MNINWLERKAGNLYMRLTFATFALATVFCVSGCKSVPEDQQAGLAAAASQAIAVAERAPGSSTNAPVDPGKLLLREGDTIRIIFPGAANLNTLAAIRRDGKITLPLIGEVQAAGLAPTDLEKRLLDQFGPQLQTKEVTVSLETSAFTVYVVGAVLRPGKIVSDRPLSALEAIMEAGGFDQVRANLKKIRVIRYLDGQPQYHTLNMKGILAGQGTGAFALRPSDILFVPERFTWF